MSVGIAGLGWVTPLGTDLENVRGQIEAGIVPETKTLTNPETGRIHRFFATPPSAVAAVSKNPRLRRSSTISLLAVTAGLAAIEHAGGNVAPERTAVVFAISDGGVLYTRKFYDQIVKQGAHAASPMLFPETVYNAPASHLAALLGLDGASYTLVGDSSVGLTALHFATELLETSSDLDQVVVVGAEECDWILCEACATWRLASTPLAEGAAALVLQREGRWKLRTHPGAPFFKQREASAALARVLRSCGALAAVPRDEASRRQPATRASQLQRAIVSANGTFIDRAEAAALAAHFPNIPILAPKKSLGESPGASALQQVILAALTAQPALVTVIGFNHQAGAVLVEPA